MLALHRRRRTRRARRSTARSSRCRALDEVEKARRTPRSFGFRPASGGRGPLRLLPVEDLVGDGADLLAPRLPLGRLLELGSWAPSAPDRAPELIRRHARFTRPENKARGEHQCDAIPSRIPIPSPAGRPGHPHAGNEQYHTRSQFTGTTALHHVEGAATSNSGQDPAGCVRPSVVHPYSDAPPVLRFTTRRRVPSGSVGHRRRRLMSKISPEAVGWP
jgi:hypothetical protein